MALVISILFAVSTCIFSLEENVQPSAAARAARTEVAGHPNGWGADDAFWIAARYHMPMIGLTARDEWGPSSDGLSLPWGYRLDFISAEGYAGAISLIHWVLIPMLILSLSGFLQRRT